MPISDQLIKSCIQQDRKAQKQLYQLLLPYLRAIAKRYLRDASYMKDALQESFVKVFKRINTYDLGKASLKQWAARITINTCINYNERVIGIPNQEFILDKHEIGGSSILTQNWDDEDLLYILKKMPHGYFEVFNLFVIDGYSHEEIANILSIDKALSRKRLSRARNWLKKIFNDQPDWLKHLSLSSFHQN